MFRFLIPLFSFLLLAQMAGAQTAKVTLSGYVRDKATGEAMIGASVQIPELKTGVNSNEYGYYSLTIPPGTYQVSFSYSGYKTQMDTLKLTGNQKRDMELEEDIVVTEEIVVQTESAKENVSSMNMSTVKVNIKTVQTLPALFGETDVLKTIQMLPGIQTAGEGTTGFFVRGGGADQNLIQLDEATVYNASHMLGFFSVFNSDAIKDIEVHKGGIPARYGGRLSSIVDIRMKEGNLKKFGLSGGIGTISSRLTVEAPFKKDRGSFIVSGRRTYADLFLKLSSDPLIRNNALYFYDLNFKANYKLGEKDRVFASAYFGRDVFANQDFFGLRWGNATATLRWNHLFSDKLFSNLTLIFSDFDYGVSFKQTDSNSGKYQYGIRDYGFKYDFSYYPSPKHKLYFGTHNIFHSFQPGRFEPGSDSSFFITYALERDYGVESSIFADHEFEISKRWGVRYGLRLTGYFAVGPRSVNNYGGSDGETPIDTTVYGTGQLIKFYPGIEPRASVKFQINEVSSLKASYNRTYQFIHQLTTSTAARPFDIWIQSGAQVKPQYGDQVALGYFHNFFKGKLETSVEVFHKWMGNQIDYKDFANIILNKNLTTQFLVGKGRAYGLELYVRKTQGKFTGWISYTLCRVERQVPGINNGQVYSANNDRRHNVAVVASYEVGKRWIFAANWIYLTGNAITFPAGAYVLDGRVVPFYDGRNGSRMPDQHRLDFSTTVKVGKLTKRWKSSLNFSLYNVYGQKNPWAISFDEDKKNPGQTKATMTYLFRWIPSLTYNFEF